MYKKNNIRFARWDVNKRLPKNAPRFLYFKDYSYKQMDNAFFSFVKRGIEYDDKFNHNLLDTSGFFHSCKKGFAITENALYSDRFVNNPVEFDNLAEVDRQGEELIFIMEDGTQRRENCGEYAHYIECVFRYGLAIDKWDYAKNVTKNSFEEEKYWQLKEIVLDYVNADCHWDEHIKKYSDAEDRLFEETKKKANAGDYDMNVALCRQFRNRLTEYEYISWLERAVYKRLNYSEEKPELDMLQEIIMYYFNEKNLYMIFHYGTILIMEYEQQGYEIFNKLDTSELYEKLSVREATDAEDYPFLKASYDLYVIKYMTRPDIEKQNKKYRHIEKDAFCRHFATTDQEVVQLFRNAEKDPYSENTQQIYRQQAEKGNEYAMYMIYVDNFDNEEGLKYLRMAAMRDYPPALYQLGRIMSKPEEECEYYEEYLNDTQAGYMLILRAAQRGYGDAVQYLLDFYRNEITQGGEECSLGIDLDWIAECADIGIAAGDYTAAYAMAQIHDISDTDDWLKMYMQAAEMGDVASAELLADICNTNNMNKEEYYWCKKIIENSYRIREHVEDEIFEKIVAMRKNGLGVPKDEYIAFRRMIAGIGYEHSIGSSYSLLDRFEKMHRDIIVSMALLACEKDVRAASQWLRFEEACRKKAGRERSICTYLSLRGELTFDYVIKNIDAYSLKFSYDFECDHNGDNYDTSNPEYVAVYQQANLLEQNGDIEAAYEIYRQYASRYSKYAQYRYGQRLIQDKQFVEGEKLLKKAMEYMYLPAVNALAMYYMEYDIADKKEEANLLMNTALRHGYIKNLDSYAAKFYDGSGMITMPREYFEIILNHYKTEYK